MSQPQPTSPLPAFVSRQVTEARRFFLNLNPDRKPSLEVVCGGVERTRSDYVVDRQDFPYFAIELVAEGEGVLSMNGDEQALSVGSVFAYGPDAPHTIRNKSEFGMRKYYVDFVGTRASKMLQEADLLRGRNDYQLLVIGGLHELTARRVAAAGQMPCLKFFRQAHIQHMAGACLRLVQPSLEPGGV